MVCTSLLTDKHEVIITTNKGQVIRTRSGEISLLGRNTQGVRLININKDELVTGVAIVLDEEVAASQPLGAASVSDTNDEETPENL
jgi:DNA gyrase subunit A